MDYLNLAEVKLFGTNGVQLSRTSLAFELASTLGDPYYAFQCNDGDLASICHSGYDARLTISYNCKHHRRCVIAWPVHLVKPHLVEPC